MRKPQLSDINKIWCCVPLCLSDKRKLWGVKLFCVKCSENFISIPQLLLCIQKDGFMLVCTGHPVGFKGSVGTSHSAQQTVLLHINQQTILTPNEIKVTLRLTVSQSVSVSSFVWGLMTRYLLTLWQLLSCPWEAALSDERVGLSFVSQYAVESQLSVCTNFVHFTCLTC
jgi:hypothetical protein